MCVEVAFGKVLRKHRLIKKLSQEELAFRCGLDRTYISLLERGQRNPSLKTIFTLSKHLNILPNEMIKEVELKSRTNLSKR